MCAGWRLSTVTPASSRMGTRSPAAEGHDRRHVAFRTCRLHQVAVGVPVAAAGTITRRTLVRLPLAADS